MNKQMKFKRCMKEIRKVKNNVSTFIQRKRKFDSNRIRSKSRMTIYKAADIDFVPKV